MSFPKISELEIPAKLLRGAQYCQAKKDIRYYLNGICLHNDGHVYGTNGHFAFKAPLPAEVAKQLKKFWIIKLEGAIPKSAVTCKINFIDDNRGFVEIYNDCLCNKVAKHIFFSVIVSDQFPDMDRVYHQKETIPTNEIGLSPVYLAVAEKVFYMPRSYVAIVIKLYGDKEAVKIVSSHLSQEGMEMLLMPIRT